MSEPSALPVADSRQVCRAAGTLLRSDRRAVVVALILTMIATGLGLVAPRLLGQIIDTVIDGGSVRTVDRLALLILGCAVLRLVTARTADNAMSRFGERTGRRLRDRLLDRVLALSPAVVDRTQPGDLLTRGSGDVTSVGTALRSAGPVVIAGMMQITLIIVAIMITSPLLGLCGLLGLAGMAIALRWYLLRARAAYLADGAATATMAEVLTSTAAGARTVAVLGLEERRLSAAREAIAASRRTRLATLRLRTVLYPSIDIAATVPVVLALLVGGILFWHGWMSLGAVAAVALYLRQLGEPLDAILVWIEQLQASAVSFARVEGVALAIEPAGGTSTTPPATGADRHRVVVAGVSFAYRRGKDVLHAVDLDVRTGERLALVGPSGAGKTTLGRLVAGLERPRRGDVRVGDVAIADLPPEIRREHVVLVTQEQHVFEASLRDNLTLAAPAAADDRLVAALQEVGAGWALDLRRGLDTELGPTGDLQPSGAQAQQMALARVVLADPHTLILDEATALLDPASARRTERALAAALHGRTVIAIAHRLQTAHDADRVGVLVDGRLVELGTHDELLVRPGPYADLWRAWHGGPPTSTS